MTEKLESCKKAVLRTSPIE